MPREELRESIRHLKEELASGDPLSGDDRRELEGVLGEVSRILETEEEPSIASEFFDDLQRFAQRLEDSHPNLTFVLGRIADSLSRLGI